MEPFEVFLFAIPSLAVAVGILIWLAKRNLGLSQIQEYRLDKFRHDIEARIADLSKQLVLSDERFKQLHHLLLDAQQSAEHKITESPQPSQDFLRRLNVDLTVKPDRQLIFVLMPFNPGYEQVFRAIKQVVQELGFRCMRGDEEFVSGNILGHILQEIVRARLIVADITTRNPNVFYELGIAHASGKPVLLIAQSEKDIPFDVGATRVLVYRDLFSLQKELRNWLVHSLAGSAD